MNSVWFQSLCSGYFVVLPTGSFAVEENLGSTECNKPHFTSEKCRAQRRPVICLGSQLFCDRAQTVTVCAPVFKTELIGDRLW